MPPVKIDDLAPSRPTELAPEQMNNLRGGTSEPTSDPLSNPFCGTTPPSPFPFDPSHPLLDPSKFPRLEPSQFPWNVDVPSGPAGPCGPSELIPI